MPVNTSSLKSQLADQIVAAVDEARRTTPLAPSITNFVTIDFVANAQLAVGGSAAMVYLGEEGEAMAAVGSALYLNMGTLLEVHEAAIPATAHAAHVAGTPWVLDPVGIGIGTLRSRILRAIRDDRPAIVRCNASEAIALARLWGLADDDAVAGVRGVDATDSVEAARASAVAIARHTGGAVAVSGEQDLVTDGSVVVTCRGGSALMTKVTGAGCSLGGVAAVYAACTTPLVAALAATNVYNVAGARAEAAAHGPASFKVAFIDELYRATAADVAHADFDVREA